MSLRVSTTGKVWASEGVNGVPRKEVHTNSPPSSLKVQSTPTREGAPYLNPPLHG